MSLIKSISGIRGTIGGIPGNGLTPVDIVKYAAAYGMWVLDQNPANPTVIIGRDARLSGSMLTHIVAGTLQGLGLNVIDMGLSTTPTVELAVENSDAAGGIILTASHNPIQWNALKLLNSKGEFLSAQDGEKVLGFAENENFSFAEVKKIGSYTTDDTWLDRHIEMVLALDLVDREAIRNADFRIAVDAVNSTGGIAVPRLLEALGVAPENIVKINCEPTGHFAHNPEPLPEHLHEISKTIESGNYHLGIVVDPDVDRLALIGEDGTAFGEEYTLVAVADYVLKHTPGNTVSNLSSTGALRDITQKAGQSYHASAVGEVNVVEAMKEHNAVIGGEGNGGVIYPALHYGRDALAGIALFLSHLARFGKSVNALRSTYPNYYISKNKIELTPEIDVDQVLAAIVRKYAKQPVNTVDGVRIDFDKDWVHLRKSNTEPIIRIYSEADLISTANNLANKLIMDIKEILSAPKE